MAKKSELKAEERMEAVLALLRREESAAVLARRYQVSEVTLYRWRDVFLAAGKAPLGQAEGSAESAAARRIEQLQDSEPMAEAKGADTGGLSDAATMPEHFCRGLP
jgi:transposase-like protein